MGCSRSCTRINANASLMGQNLRARNAAIARGGRLLMRPGQFSWRLVGQPQGVPAGCHRATLGSCRLSTRGKRAKRWADEQAESLSPAWPGGAQRNRERGVREALISGRSGIRQITSFDTSAYLPCRWPGGKQSEVYRSRHVRHMGRFAVGRRRRPSGDARRGPMSRMLPRLLSGVCLGPARTPGHSERGFEQFLVGGAAEDEPGLQAMPSACCRSGIPRLPVRGPDQHHLRRVRLGPAAVGARERSAQTSRCDAGGRSRWRGDALRLGRDVRHRVLPLKGGIPARSRGHSMARAAEVRRGRGGRRP